MILEIQFIALSRLPGAVQIITGRNEERERAGEGWGASEGETSPWGTKAREKLGRL